MLPMLYSFILATQYSHHDYNNFLSCFLYANLLSSMSVVPYSSIILSTKLYNHKPYLFSFFISILGGLLSPFFIVSTDITQLMSHMIIIIMYSLGSSLVSITALYFNANLDNKNAAIVTGVSITIPYITGISILMITEIEHSSSILLLISFLLASVGFFYTLKLLRSNICTKTLTKTSIKESLLMRIENIQLLLFSFGILLSHNILLSFLNKNFSSEQVSAYVLGYQIFSIGIFLPSISANYIIPQLSTKKTFNIKKTFMLFFLFGVIWISFMALFSEEVLDIYNIKKTKENIIIFLILQGAVFTCVINTFINQIIAAKQQYQHLALSSMFFLAFTIFYIYYYAYNKKIEIVILSLIFGYILVSIASIYSYKRGAVHERK